MNRVLSATKITHNLFPVSDLCDADHKIFLTKDKRVDKREDMTLSHKKRDEGMYSVELYNEYKKVRTAADI